MVLIASASISIPLGLALDSAGETMAGPTDRMDPRAPQPPRGWFNPNLVTLAESTDPKKIRKFREKLARRAAERGDLAPEALAEWGYLIPQLSKDPSGS